jgi:flagellar biosynthesis/type III secretory pathway protein FliH
LLDDRARGEWSAFRPLFVPPPAVAQPEPEAKPKPPPETPPDELSPQMRAAIEGASREYLAELRRAYAAAQEALERGVAETLATLAERVLGRELALAPADVEALVGEALETFARERPIALRVAPSVAAKFESSLPLRGDAALEPGDLVLETADGEIDLRIATRARELLRALRAG